MVPGVHLNTAFRSLALTILITSIQANPLSLWKKASVAINDISDLYSEQQLDIAHSSLSDIKASISDDEGEYSLFRRGACMSSGKSSDCPVANTEGYGIFIDAQTCSPEMAERARVGIEDMQTLAIAGIAALKSSDVRGAPWRYFFPAYSSDLETVARNLLGWVVKYTAGTSIKKVGPIRVYCSGEDKKEDEPLQDFDKPVEVSHGPEEETAMILHNSFVNLSAIGIPCRGPMASPRHGGIGGETAGRALLQQVIRAIVQDRITDLMYGSSNSQMLLETNYQHRHPAIRNAGSWAWYAQWSWDLGFGGAPYQGKKCLEKFKVGHYDTNNIAGGEFYPRMRPLQNRIAFPGSPLPGHASADNLQEGETSS
ncbi:MAG: hypothetical protein M1825_005771 [Sarcosagium campestre]|nr:MAG: hypothetical protein M1825_005771 [Sarcosagium campestre]